MTDSACAPDDGLHRRGEPEGRRRSFDRQADAEAMIGLANIILAELGCG